MTIQRFFIAIILAGVGCCACKQKNDAAKQSLQLTANLGGAGYDTTNTIYVATTLFNPTRDTIRFLTMACSYSDLFITDTAAFKVVAQVPCYSNVPVIIAIPPNSKLDQYITIRAINKNIKMGDSKLRIGLYILKSDKKDLFRDVETRRPMKIEQDIRKQFEDGREIDKLFENKQNAAVLWSNQLDLKRLYFEIYQ
jgi:hypothetical protein